VKFIAQHFCVLVSHIIHYALFHCLSPRRTLDEQPRDGERDVRNDTEEIADTACIRVAALDVVLLPIERPCDLVGNIVTDDVVPLNFCECQVWVVDACN
jgi:hypothetical protein